MAETARQLEELQQNDPLAHVWRLIEVGNPDLVEQQVHSEFISDMGERTGHANKERHFYKSWDYRLEDNDLISDTGLSLRELSDNGLAAAANAVCADNRFAYHYLRAQVQAIHPDMLIDWRKSGDPRCVRLISLCPEEAEIDKEIAELGNFKPDRGMASTWIFEPTPEGMRLHAFSQDNSTLGGQAENDRRLGVHGGDYSSSLAKLSQLDYLDFTDGLAAVKAHQEIHDQRLERLTGLPHHFGIANPTFEESIAAVESKPEAWSLYWEAVQDVADSLQSKPPRVTPQLAKLVMELRQAYEDPEAIPLDLQIYWQRPFHEDQARLLMDYLRERVIPQYVFGAPETYKKERTEQVIGQSSGSYGELATAGAHSVENNIVHSGDCPGAAGSRAQTKHGADAEMAGALQIFGTKFFETDKCRNCKDKGHKVRAWMRGEVVGCIGCGRQENVCTGQVLKEGKKTAKNRVQSIGEMIVSAFSNHWRRISQKNSKQQLKLVKNT